MVLQSPFQEARDINTSSHERYHGKISCYWSSSKLVLYNYSYFKVLDRQLREGILTCEMSVVTSQSVYTLQRYGKPSPKSNLNMCNMYECEVWCTVLLLLTSVVT